MAANEQGKFWEMHDKLFANQQNLDAASLEKYAKEIGLDMAKFKAATESHKFAAQIEADIKQGGSVGVQGTPASFLNGHFNQRRPAVRCLKEIADEELARPRRQGPSRRLDGRRPSRDRPWPGVEVPEE